MLDVEVVGVLGGKLGDGVKVDELRAAAQLAVGGVEAKHKLIGSTSCKRIAKAFVFDPLLEVVGFHAVLR
ncbi:MAG: hypothetical protein GTO63_02590 [Anaerolineae bacterium]|nr:hypothetical protein [Anaerolineae bacterium]NIN93426.1 hypothetical protein [Anaerolineae bacterium]NIQ76530.1 hypothetical protein [Anaerolineae bacterium]